VRLGPGQLNALWVTPSYREPRRDARDLAHAAARTPQDWQNALDNLIARGA
jgi:hypothetical protein